jgi:signal peptidase I
MMNQPDEPGRRASEEDNFVEERTEPTSGPAPETAILPDDATTKRRKRSSGARQAVEWIVLIAIALAIAIVIKTFLFQAFYIPSESMVPTLKKDDRVLVNKLSYKLHNIHRGDIVVFTKPPSETSDIKDLVKRVIGLPNETVEGRDGHIYINGKLLKEGYLPKGTVTSTFGPTTIPSNSIWVMGDNRTYSRDSRYFGPILKSSVVGRVFVRIWPPPRFRFL